MLKQFSVSQRVLGAIVLLFAWCLSTKQASADVPTGTIAFLSDRHQDEKPPFQVDISVYVINADGLNEKPWVFNNLKNLF